jgi:hypothetical protein
MQRGTRRVAVGGVAGSPAEGVTEETAGFLSQALSEGTGETSPALCFQALKRQQYAEGPSLRFT